jgi:ATP-dependent helicase/nuclease subunit A
MNAPKPRQWDAIRCVDRHTLVAAGAGTGKTTTVVHRILYLLGVEVNGERLTEPVPLSRIAAITYTNAAAADLRRKLRRALRDAGLREAAYEVDLARIGTIHGFAGDILREFALRAGREPGARNLDEAEAGAVVDDVVRDTLLSVLGDGAIDGLGELLASHGVGAVERWVARLVSDSDRLLRIVKTAAPRSVAEGALVALAERTLVRLDARFEELGALDFDRMIVWTRDLLRDRPAVCRALQRRIHTLIVDEFQDVDPVQREIAYLLGDPASRSTHTTRLMLVGDPKQSIYRFRRADVTVWSGVERDFRAGLGEVVTLEDNFRSVAPILGLVDATVGRILDRPLDGTAHQDFEVRFAPVKAARGSAVGPAVELVSVNGANAAARRRAEAREVARRIGELRAEGVRPGEIAVLLTSWGDLEIYEAALREAGHPTYALRAEGFYECREVLDLVLALEAIRDPRDDRALFGWLRSPFAGVRDETLLEIALAGSAPHWDHLDAGATGEPDLIARAVALLREHAAIRDRVPVADLLESMIERSGYLGHLALQGDAGRQAIANVRKLIDRARRAPEQGVGDFLRTIRDARARKTKEPGARLFGEGDDIVTITSVHSAKGLEWRVVFWCDLTRVSPNHTDQVLIGRDRLALRDPDSETPSVQWTALEQAEALECEAERKRLWYVAATRAKDLLVLSGLSDKPREGTAAAGIRGELADGAGEALVRYAAHDGTAFEALYRVVEAAEDDAPPAPATEDEAEISPSPAPIPTDDGRLRHSATELMLRARCERRHWIRYVAGLREPALDAPAGGGQGEGAVPGATIRGQIVHDVLEHLGDDEVDRLLETAIGRWDPEAPTPEAPAGAGYRHRLRRDIEAVAGNADYQALASRPDARREVGFLHLAGGEVCLEGAIDLLARDGDGLVVLDVKTHPGGGDMSGEVRRYALQRDVYIAAVEAITGEPVTRFAFQFPDAGQRSEPVTPALREAGRERIAAAIAGIGRGIPGLAHDPGECVRCGYRGAGWCPGTAAPGA